MYIYSNNNKKKILGAVYRYKNISNKRKNISPIDEYLQVSSQKYKKNDSIKPHVHLKNKRTTLSTQEIWLVLKGRLSIKIFDTDKTKIKNFILNKGDIYILFSGGHSLEVLSNSTEFYEIKNGPYKKKVKDIEYL
jgi:cupin fold WbuC family metalloprotein